jgi:hypothetical protein
MVEDARKDPRLIGGVYQVGQVITYSPTLTTYTAYNRNTNDVVGLLVFELPPNVEAEAARRLLEPLERRRQVESPHVIHVFNWGIDGSHFYIATDPPRGISLRAVLDNETLNMNPSLTPPASVLPVVDGTLRTDEISSDPHGKDVSLQNILDVDGGREYAYLYFEEEGGKAHRFAIKGTYVVVGRVDPKRGLKPEIDLTSVDPGMTVSRQHARIRFWKTFFSIEDLKSRNKTRLGELALTPFKAELLQDGDILHFGSVRVIFKVLDPG